MPTLWENENHDKWKAIFQSDFDSCRLWFKDEVGLGEGTLIFCAVYLAPRVKEYISNEGALSRPTESFPWELWSANEALDTWSSCFSWFWLRALINSVGLFFFFFYSEALCSAQRLSASCSRALAVCWGRGFPFCLTDGGIRGSEKQSLSYGHKVGCKVCPYVTGCSVDWNETSVLKKWMESHTKHMLW